ncbi:rCG54616 [Rattus norvegicus]|uniref:RCG54616 n=1 Tax=Rattus norvegicus TaxID=10116 RepID=A6JAA2_RAT|nr:rCG54616 [Rattus norvegicus]
MFFGGRISLSSTAALTPPLWLLGLCRCGSPHLAPMLSALGGVRDAGNRRTRRYEAVDMPREGAELVKTSRHQPDHRA